MSEKAKLCGIVQGVQFTITSDDERPLKAIILRDALEQYFGADEEPQTWLSAYLRHQDIIDRAAAERHRRDSALTLTVLRADRPEDFRFVAIERAA